ncbi:MAG TPA: dienelactone hydrolase family protein [Chthoniobacterales bacterium]|nr:dienelactone hydrolase family protein [Chthoniobacterales bacterium]
MNAILEAEPIFMASTAISSSPAPHRTAEQVDVADHHVRVDVYEPPLGRHAHTVLLLHGTGGLLGDGALLRRAAKSLASHDFRACVVHYFNTTGTFFATQSNVCAHSTEWRDALITIAHQYAEAAGEPVGFLGYSLGGSLAVKAAQETPDIGAVAVLAGGLLDKEDEESEPHLPPLLVLHGGQDTRVPMECADALVKLGRRAGAVVESVVYPKEGHTLGATAERDAFDRAAEFFAARLGAGANG